MNDFVDEYRKSDVVSWFHSFPHVNISFRVVNATFNPDNNDYIEALGILASVPAFWLILTLLAFLIFFLVRCCQTNWKKKKNLTALKWILAIFAILCCGGVAVGLYGNHQAHNGIVEVEGSIDHIAETLSLIKNETKSMEHIIQFKMNPDLGKLDHIFSKPRRNTSAHSLLRHAFKLLMMNVTNGLTEVQDINEKISSVGIDKIPDLINEVESYRWPATMALLVLFIVFCLILIIGVARSSRGPLICFSVFGLLSVVVCWILVAAYLVISVGTSDFCDNPEPFYDSQVHSNVEKEILSYYMECKESSIISPFANAIKSGQKAVENIQLTLKSVRDIGLTLYGKDVLGPLNDLQIDVSKISNVLDNLAAQLYCESIHHDYISAMDSLCLNIVEGMALMLLSAIISGLLFTILIWIASHTWIYIRKKRPTESVDEADPFLPPSAAMRRGRDTSSIVSGYSSGGRDMYGSTGYVRPRYTHTPPQTPHFATYNGRSRHTLEEYPLPLHGRLTPPPTYEHVPNYYIKA